MENEKRKVGDYTVLCAVNIGAREIILAENEQSTNGERFLCCYGERNDIFEKFTECAVGDDYIDAALFFAERIKQDAERFREEVEKLDIPVTVITQADCIPDHYKNDINGKIIAINPAILKPEYQRADRQLYYVTGGFGASANARGSAVFCKNLYDGKNTRFERMDVLGEVKPECMPDWAEKKAILFRHTQSSKLMFEYCFRPHLADIGSGSGFVLQNVNLGLLRVHHDGDKAAVAGTVKGKKIKSIGSAAKHALTWAVCRVGFIGYLVDLLLPA